jgi:hypothetical protein
MSGDYGKYSFDLFSVPSLVPRLVTFSSELINNITLSEEFLKNQIKYDCSDSYFTETFHIDASLESLNSGTGNTIPVNKTVSLKKNDGNVIFPLSKYILKGL